MIEEITSCIASSLVGQLEQEFQAVIPNDWTTDEIKRRCKLVRQIGLPFETLYVDDKPVLEIHPMQFEQIREDDRFILRATQNFRRLS